MKTIDISKMAKEAMHLDPEAIQEFQEFADTAEAEHEGNFLKLFEESKIFPLILYDAKSECWSYYLRIEYEDSHINPICTAEHWNTDPLCMMQDLFMHGCTWIRENENRWKAKINHQMAMQRQRRNQQRITAKQNS